MVSEGTKDKYRQICDVYTTGYILLVRGMRGIKKPRQIIFPFMTTISSFMPGHQKRTLKEGGGGGRGERLYKKPQLSAV